LKEEGICVNSCSDGYYENSGNKKKQISIDIKTCLKCFASCKLCTGPTSNECLTCEESSPAYYYGFCLDVCPFGTLLNLDYQCICHPTCGKTSFNIQYRNMHTHIKLSTVH
jgi:proprotein convertase subtilisin/kexin type 5